MVATGKQPKSRVEDHDVTPVAARVVDVGEDPAVILGAGVFFLKRNAATFS
jgi:hypothetical protein